MGLAAVTSFELAKYEDHSDYIHLRKAKFIGGNGESFLTNNHGFLRCRLSSIDGFSITETEIDHSEK